MEDLNNKFVTMMPLDMLAEVASATLQSDPSLTFSCKSSCNNFNKICSSKKSINSSDRLTLNQIKALSDKMLLEIFSELTSDEMRKNYSFKCYLMPDKCSETFTSFGNEARSRLQMKNHLLSHISNLLAESKDNSVIAEFTAEPLHVLKKRLEVKNPKFSRKKKSKQQTVKKKNNKIYNKKECYQKSFESSKQKNYKEINSDSHDSYQSSKNLHIKLSTKSCKNKLSKKRTISTTHSDFNDLVTGDNHYRDLSDKRVPPKNQIQNFFKERTCLDLHDDSYLSFLDDLSNSNEKSTLMLEEAHQESSSSCDPQDSFKRHELATSNNSSSAHKDTVCVTMLSEIFSPLHHDHTYTSVNGRTYRLENPFTVDNYKMAKTLRRSVHQCLGTAVQMIIPTPPFPYVYVPLLPHISEIAEVGDSCIATCDQCLHDSYLNGLEVSDSDIINFHCHVESADETEVKHFHIDRTATFNESDIESEDDEDILSDSSEVDISDDEAISDVSDSKSPDIMFCVDDHLQMDCPENSQTAEKA